MEGRFFYSTDGTDVYGPVTEAELSRLCRVNAIGERSFVCRVGETAWEPFKPDEYRSPAAALAAPAAIPTVVSALPPPSPEPTAAPQTHAAPPGDGDTVAAVVLNIASGVAVLGAAAIVALLRRPPLPMSRARWATASAALPARSSCPCCWAGFCRSSPGAWRAR
ncbi:MAG: hypothetical protein WDO13_18610 [Verrucomicrobiota bacterium]